MITLGIDPALRTTGYAILKKEGNNIIYIASGIITTDKQEMSIAIAKIMDAISLIINKYRPLKASMETIFINKNPESSIKLSHARGAIMGVIAQHNIPIEEYAPNFVKKAITGAGKADKDQMKQMINMLLPGNDFQQHDEIDAISIAYTSILHQNLNKILNKSQQMV